MQQVTKKILSSNKEQNSHAPIVFDEPPPEPEEPKNNRFNAEHISKIIEHIFQLACLGLLSWIFVFATNSYLDKNPDLLGKVLMGLLAVILVVFGLGGIIEKYIKK